MITGATLGILCMMFGASLLIFELLKSVKEDRNSKPLQTTHCDNGIHDCSWCIAEGKKLSDDIHTAFDNEECHCDSCGKPVMKIRTCVGCGDTLMNRAELRKYSKLTGK